MSLRKRFTLHPRQYEFFWSPARFRAYIGGIRSGKTYVGALAMLTELLKTPGSLGMVVAPTYTVIRDSTWRTFREISEGVVKWLVLSEYRAVLANESEVIFRSGEDPNRLRGPTLKAFWVDEAAQTSEDVWTIGVGRLSVRGARGWITTTPRGKNHWTYKRFSVSDPDYSFFFSRTDENPWLDPAYLKSVQAAFSGLYAEQELGGRFVEPEGALFERDWFEVIEEAQVPQGLGWIRSWDLAVSASASADRTASLKMAFDPDGTLYLAEGLCGRWEWPETKELLIKMAEKEGPGVTVIIEKVAFQQALIQELYLEPRILQNGIPLLPDYPTAVPPSSQYNRKVTDARRWQALAAAGRIKLIKGAWNDDFLEEVCSFVPIPREKSTRRQADDWVDAVNIGLRHLGVPAALAATEEGGLLLPQTFDPDFSDPDVLETLSGSLFNMR